MLIAGAIGVFVSILLAFLWKVPDLLDELSGRKAKRQITRMKELNIGTGGIEGISTNELYEMINASGNLVWGNLGTRSQNLEEDDEQEKVEVVPKEDERVEEVVEKEAPEPTVPEDVEVVEVENQEIDIDEDDDDEVPTGNLTESDVDFSNKDNDKVNVVVIEEQMSIMRG